jgi:hypothetical protein
MKIPLDALPKVGKRAQDALMKDSSFMLMKVLVLDATQSAT